MADRGKVRRFFEVAEIEKQFSSLTEQLCSFYKNRLEADGEDESQKIAQVQRFVFGEVKKLIFPLMEDIYTDTFTDSELDELISIHSSPTFQRLRELAPGIQQKMFSELSDSMSELEEKIEGFVNNLFDESDEGPIVPEDRVN